jgi:outer membrane protein assembly factor BamE (lipoprotein component of BamABCDE complex)
VNDLALLSSSGSWESVLDSVKGFSSQIEWSNSFGLTKQVFLIMLLLIAASGFDRDSTIYAPGYSWTKFSSIREGMTPEEVTRILGPPLSIEPFPRQTMYWYSRLRNVKGEYVMLVHFSDAGKVYQIDADRIGHYCRAPGEPLHPSGFLEWLEWNLP